MINLLVAIVLNGLVVFTVTYFMTLLDGPMDIFKRLREWAGIQHDAYGEHEVVPNKFFAKLLDCMWCTGTWVSAGVSVFTVIIIGASWYMWFYVWLVSIALAGLVNKVVTYES